MTTELSFHPIAELFPLLLGKDFDALKADIEARGLIEELAIYQGKILDGRNRYRACCELRIDPKVAPYDGDDPLGFVLAKNLHRRHLSESQRAMIAARLATMPRGRPSKKAPIGAFTEDEAAERLNVGQGTVDRAKAVLASGDDKLIAAVTDGEITVTAAYREVRKKETKTPPLPKGKFRVIYADPPWQYADTRQEVEYYGPAERHYPSMSLTDLCALDVTSITTQDAVLFLWVTSPMLSVCWQVIQAWGFSYKASFVWDKVKHNYGHYNSVRHEFLLICTKGTCLPEDKHLVDSVQSIERTAHSEKPEAFRTIIEKMYPNGRRLELFARKTIKGWSAFGNELAGIRPISSDED